MAQKRGLVLPSRSVGAAGVVDAVRDQFSRHWIRFGTPEESIWFEKSDLISSASDVFTRLSNVGIPCLRRAGQEAVRKLVEDHKRFRKGLVASGPGWIGPHFVFGDGTVAQSPAAKSEVIVAFSPHEKFAPVGSLPDWHTEVGRVVAGQRLPLFMLALAFVGPLVRFAPPGYANPMVELVGLTGSGKSILGSLAMSVWAGNPDSDIGGCESWNLTTNALEDQKQQHQDMLLVLDEGNLAGPGRRARSEFLQEAVFKMATTGQKRRFGDRRGTTHVRLVMLSTTNTPLAELVETDGMITAALHSRIATVNVPQVGTMGVLSSLPRDFATTREAMEQLRAAVDANYGVAGRAFVKRLVHEVATDEAGLRRSLEQRLYSYMESGAYQAVSPRLRKSIALIQVAGQLAVEYGILLRSWGPIRSVVREVEKAHLWAQEESQSGAFDAIREYVQRHRDELVLESALSSPCSEESFTESAGFLGERDGRQILYVPAHRFRRAIAEHKTVMKRLRSTGQAMTETGKQPKLTIKAPRHICRSGRVCAIYLEEATSNGTA
jgi:hypothetical protein